MPNWLLSSMMFLFPLFFILDYWMDRWKGVLVAALLTIMLVGEAWFLSSVSGFKMP